MDDTLMEASVGPRHDVENYMDASTDTSMEGHIDTSMEGSVEASVETSMDASAKASVESCTPSSYFAPANNVRVCDSFALRFFRNRGDTTTCRRCT